MADKHIDILKSLQHCQIKPPPNLFKRIWSVLKKHKANSEDSSLSGTISSEDNIDYAEEYHGAEIEIFRSLQNYIVTPPAFSTLKIGSAIDNDNAIYLAKKPVRIIKFRYFGRVAAAILIIGCGVWFGHNKKKSNNENEAVTTNVSTQNNLPGTSTKPVTNTGIVESKINNHTTSKTVLIAKADKHDHINITGNLRKTDRARTHSQAGKLVDNDILLTLVSYNYTDYMPLLSEIKKNNKIKLDQFSYVTISDKMNSILKKMYATKRNNKPTRKAKRIRAKIENGKNQMKSILMLILIITPKMLSTFQNLFLNNELFLV